jgi:hypothetical protein
MIASNYRKYPEAMALQLVLAFGRCCWHTARPTTRQGRAVRAERSRLVADRPQIVQWTKGSIPAWWKAAKHAARELAKAVKQSLRDLVWDQVEEPQERDPMAELFDQAERFEDQHPDSFRVPLLTRRIRNPYWQPTWEHFGVGGGGAMAYDYRG